MDNQRKKYHKALETLLYVANLEQRSYWALKVIYHADKEHLKRFGRQLFGDYYRAMKYGPCPSLAYDIVKDVRGEGWFNFSDPSPSTALEVPSRRTLLPRREANTRLLSESDIECLDYAYNLIKDMSFSQLKKFSHDEAYDAVDQDEEISLESIISTLENSEEVLDYLRS